MEVSKSVLRKCLLQYRRLLSQKEYQIRNQHLLHAIKEISKPYRSLHCFLPIARNKEPDLTSLFETWWQTGKNVVVPMTDFQGKTLRHVLLNEGDKLQFNEKQIPEPIGAIKFDLEKIDLIFVPLLCADKQMSRIGYGGGFYDRFLPKTNALKIGLSLSPLFDEFVQTEEHDFKLDQIIYYKS